MAQTQIDVNDLLAAYQEQIAQLTHRALVAETNARTLQAELDARTPADPQPDS